MLETAIQVQVNKTTPTGCMSKQREWQDKPFEWTEEHASTFREICQEIQGNINEAPDELLQFHLASDAWPRDPSSVSRYPPVPGEGVAEAKQQQSQEAAIPNQLGSHETRAQRRKSVKALREPPLRYHNSKTRVPLKFPGRNVVTTSVSCDISQRVFPGDVLRVPAYDEAKLAFIVSLVVCLSVLY